MKNRLNMVGVVLIVFSIVAFVGLSVYANKQDKKRQAEITAVSEKYDRKLKSEDEMERKAINSLHGIVFCEDVLTSDPNKNETDYSSILEKLISSNIYKIPVINMEIGAKSANTETSSLSTVLQEVYQFKIPSNLSEVKIPFKLIKGEEVSPLVHDYANGSLCTINGVEGTIIEKQQANNLKEAVYYFKRSNVGKAVVINKGTKIIISSSNLYENYIPIIFVGQNGGWKNYKDLIAQQKSILNLYTKNKDRNKDKYLIVGITSGNKASRSGLEQAMTKAYGNKYLNLRQYLSISGLHDADISPTKEDSLAMKSGAVPISLMYDQVQFNPKGQELIANAIYKKLDSLGYFDELKKAFK